MPKLEKSQLRMRDIDHALQMADAAAKGLRALRKTPSADLRKSLRTEAYDGILADLIERPGELLVFGHPKNPGVGSKGSGWPGKLVGLNHAMHQMKVIEDKEWGTIDNELAHAQSDSKWPIFSEK